MKSPTYRKRRLFLAVIAACTLIVLVALSGEMWQPYTPQAQERTDATTGVLATDALAAITVKGRAPKTHYDRAQFGDGWMLKNGCDTRNIILHRDLDNPVVGEDCKVLSGTLNDPYTGKTIEFRRGVGTSGDIQVDHVVALSDAWQKGAQQLTLEQRIELANDPLELLAVDGKANQDKSDGDAATWLPPNKLFRCQYVARQIAVKTKYLLWMTQAEHDAIRAVLSRCPGQLLPTD